MNKISCTDIALQVNTIGDSDNAVLLSLGGIAFNRFEGDFLEPHFSCVADIKDSAKYGEMDYDVLLGLATSPTMGKLFKAVDRYSVFDLLVRFDNWYNLILNNQTDTQKISIWFYDARAGVAVLENLYSECKGLPNPWIDQLHKNFTKAIPPGLRDLEEIDITLPPFEVVNNHSIMMARQVIRFEALNNEAVKIGALDNE